MVIAAVLAARPSSDASLALAADLGALLHTRVLIRVKKWDLRATLGLVPALLRHHTPLDRVRADVTRLVEGCTAPRDLRPVTVATLGASAQSYDDTTTVVGHTYTYAVSAVNVE